MVLIGRFADNVPAALVVPIGGTIGGIMFDLADEGVEVLGEVPSGLAAPALFGDRDRRLRRGRLTPRRLWNAGTGAKPEQGYRDLTDEPSCGVVCVITARPSARSSIESGDVEVRAEALPDVEVFAFDL